jgi:hypothetical protein
MADGGRVVPRPVPGGGTAAGLAARLVELARQVRRLAPPGRHDPEAFWRNKSEIAAEIADVAHDAQRDDR